MVFHVSDSYSPPDSSLRIRSDDCDQITPSTGLAKYSPAGLLDLTTLTTDYPRGVAIFVYNFFNFLW